MRRHSAFYWCLLILSFLSGLTWAREFQPTPPFTGTALPLPPQQSVAWTPPTTTLPPALISATKVLFEQGLADPRGCEYREIQVGSGTCWQGDAGVSVTHGWILPATLDDPLRYAVCWNGLVYPVVSVGEKADLQADITAILKAEKSRAESNKAHPERMYLSRQNATPEALSFSYTSMLPIKTCLLLRLGEKTLAQQFWTVILPETPALINNNDVTRNDPYLQLATDWTWALFDRAVCAHMRGDDRLALLCARALTVINQAVETKASARNFARPTTYDAHGKDVPNSPYLTFLKPLSQLLADQERRANVPHSTAVSVKTLTAETDKTKRIAGLIQALDEVAARQDGQPGGVTLARDPIVQALIAEGEIAVEPLLACLESDIRLTRSVSFHRDFFTNRNFIPVTSAAYVALAGILQTDAFAPKYEETPQATAARIRAAWKNMKGVTLEERWYRTLADETATPEEWIAAINSIVQATNVSNVPGSGWVMTQPVAPGVTPPMRGESLRGKANPSVAELMAKRIRQLAVKRVGNSQDTFYMAKVSDIALNMAQWDLPAALPVLQEQIQLCAAMNDYDGMLACAIARMTLQRMRGEDPRAIADYLAWIPTVKLGQLGDNGVNACEPLWRFPDEPVLAAAAETLFNDPASPFAHLLSKEASMFRTEEFIGSVMLSVPGFRKHLLTALADTSVIGTLTLGEDRKRNDIKFNSGHSIGFQVAPAETLIPEPGVAMPIRLCDMYGWYLAQAEGMPVCQLYWPTVERDRALMACRTLLQQYGARYNFNPALSETLYPGSYRKVKARMSFSPLAQAATVEDVQQGRAIFVLPADAQKRIVSLPPFPLLATLKKNPREYEAIDPDTGRSEKRTVYNYPITVWQAEEMLLDGTWQRFFGVVEPHGLTRVPAEDVVFSTEDSWQWGRLTNAIDCQVSMPSVRRYPLDAPLPLTLTLRNRSGLDTRVPSIFNLPFDDGRPSLRPGTTPHLFFSTDPPTELGGKKRAWTELPTLATQDLGWRVNEAWKPLGPGAVYSAVTLDLHSLYSLTQLGYYRFSFTFANANPGYDFAEGNTNEVRFELVNGGSVKPAQQQ